MKMKVCVTSLKNTPSYSLVECPSWSKETDLRSVVRSTRGFDPRLHYQSSVSSVGRARCLYHKIYRGQSLVHTPVSRVRAPYRANQIKKVV
jgi:hypothetical protein